MSLCADADACWWLNASSNIDLHWFESSLAFISLFCICDCQNGEDILHFVGTQAGKFTERKIEIE